jgi:hypothetical protein
VSWLDHAFQAELTSQYSRADAIGKLARKLDPSTSRIKKDQQGVLEGKGQCGKLAFSCNLSRADRQDIKLRFYDLLVQLALQDDAYLEACSAYQEVWDTEEVKADEAREVNVSSHSAIPSRIQLIQQVIENIIIFVVLASYNNEQSDMLHKLYSNPSLQKAPVH